MELEISRRWQICLHFDRKFITTTLRETKNKKKTPFHLFIFNHNIMSSSQLKKLVKHQALHWIILRVQNALLHRKQMHLGILTRKNTKVWFITIFASDLFLWFRPFSVFVFDIAVNKKKHITLTLYRSY